MTIFRWDATVKQQPLYSPPLKMQEFQFGSWLHSLLVEICFPSHINAFTDICNGDQDKHCVVTVRTLLVKGRGGVRVRDWGLHYVTQGPHKDRSPVLCACGSSPDQHHGQQSGSTKKVLMGRETESLETNYSRYSFSEQHEPQKDQARNTPS